MCVSFKISPSRVMRFISFQSVVIVSIMKYVLTNYNNYTQDHTRFTFHRVTRNLTFATCVCPSTGNNFTYYFNVKYDRYIYINYYSTMYFSIIITLCALNFVTVIGLVCLGCRTRGRVIYKKKRMNGFTVDMCNCESQEFESSARKKNRVFLSRL